MSKELEALESIIETFYDKDSEGIQIVRKALEAFGTIKKYAVLNRAFKDQTKHKHNLVLIEIKALIPDEEYDSINEALK